MRSKDDVLEAVWTAMELARASHTKKVHDKIPYFRGAQEAAERVFSLPAWQNAKVLKGNPDKAQRPLRQRALEEGKVLYMAVPRLKQEQCFIELDPGVLEVSPKEAATISGAFRHGQSVFVEEMRPVDLVISGSVAVNRLGTRVSKGGGYADLEYGLAITAGIVDYVATPEEVIHCSREMPRPTGIYWEDLNESKISKIPVLQKLRGAT